MNSENNNVLTIYGLGGAGINIAKKFRDVKTERGSCIVRTFMSDTSSANIRGTDIDNAAIYEDKDGSGGIRNTNFEDIKERSKKFLYENKPSKFVLVIHSVAGGTGSVMGPVIVDYIRNMKDEDRVVIPVVIGDTSHLKAAENSIATLQTYENFARNHNKPIVMVYEHNQSSLAEVDRRLEVMISSIILLLSRDNMRIDSEDIRNFFEYTRVTNHPPGIGILNAYTGEQDIPRGLVATAIQLKNENDSSVNNNLMVEYKKDGYVPSDVTSVLTVDMPITFTVTLNAINPTVAKIKETIRGFEELRETHTYESIGYSGGKTDSSGFVL
jgi:cell division GTPase FtsZ